MEAVEKQGHGIQEHKRISRDERTEELLLNGMRIREGISALSFMRHTGRTFEEVRLVSFPVVGHCSCASSPPPTPLSLSRQMLNMKRVRELQEQGFVVYDDQAGLQPTRQGMSLIDSLLPLMLTK